MDQQQMLQFGLRLHATNMLLCMKEGKALTRLAGLLVCRSEHCCCECEICMNKCKCGSQHLAMWLQPASSTKAFVVTIW